MLAYVAFLLIGYLVLRPQTAHSDSDLPAVIPAWVTGDVVFNAIGRCESWNAKLGANDLKAKNPTSSASGEFQIINSTWYEEGLKYWGQDFYKKNIWTTDNRELAWYIYQKRGTRDWNASKACWGKYVK